MAWEQRASIFLKAAFLIGKNYRFQINSASMLSTGKNVHQTEIDAACELIEKVGGTVAGISFLIDLSFLGGRKKLGQHQILIKFLILS